MSELHLTGTLWVESPDSLPEELLGQQGITSKSTLLLGPPAGYEGTLYMLGFGPGSQVSGVVSARASIDTVELALRYQSPFSGPEVVSLLAQTLHDLTEASYRHVACRPGKSGLDSSTLIAKSFTEVDGVMLKTLKSRQSRYA